MPAKPETMFYFLLLLDSIIPWVKQILIEESLAYDTIPAKTVDPTHFKLILNDEFYKDEDSI